MGRNVLFVRCVILISVWHVSELRSSEALPNSLKKADQHLPCPKSVREFQSQFQAEIDLSRPNICSPRQQHFVEEFIDNCTNEIDTKSNIFSSLSSQKHLIAMFANFIVQNRLMHCFWDLSALGASCKESKKAIHRIVTEIRQFRYGESINRHRLKYIKWLVEVCASKSKRIRVGNYLSLCKSFPSLCLVPKNSVMNSTKPTILRRLAVVKPQFSSITVLCKNSVLNLLGKYSISKYSINEMFTSCFSLCNDLKLIGTSTGTLSNISPISIECTVTKARFMSSSKNVRIFPLKVNYKNGISGCKYLCDNIHLTDSIYDMGSHGDDQTCRIYSSSFGVVVLTAVCLLLLMIFLVKCYASREAKNTFSAFSQFKEDLGSQVRKKSIKVMLLGKPTVDEATIAKSRETLQKIQTENKYEELMEAKFKLKVLQLTQNYQKDKNILLQENDQEKERILGQDKIDNLKDENLCNEELEKGYQHEIQKLKLLLEDSRTHYEEKLKHKYDRKRELVTINSEGGDSKIKEAIININSEEEEEKKKLNCELISTQDALLKRLELDLKDSMNDCEELLESERKSQRKNLKRRLELKAKSKEAKLAIKFQYEKSVAMKILIEEKEHRCDYKENLPGKQTPKPRAPHPSEHNSVPSSVEDELKKVREMHSAEAAKLQELMRSQAHFKQVKLQERLKKRRDRIENKVVSDTSTESYEKQQQKIMEFDAHAQKSKEKLDKQLQEEQNELIHDIELPTYVNHQVAVEKASQNVESIPDVKVQTAVIEAAQVEAEKLNSDHKKEVNKLLEDHERDCERLTQSLELEKKARENSLKDRLKKKRMMKEKELQEKQHSEEEKSRLLSELDKKEKEEELELHNLLEKDKQEKLVLQRKKQEKEKNSMMQVARLCAKQKVNVAKRLAESQKANLERIELEHKQKLELLEKELDQDKKLQQTRLQERLQKRRERQLKSSKEDDVVKEVENELELELKKKQSALEFIKDEQKKREEAIAKAAEDAAIEALAADAAYSSFKDAVTSVSIDSNALENKHKDFSAVLSEMIACENVEVTMEQIRVIEQFAKMMRKKYKLSSKKKLTSTVNIA